MTAPKSRAKSVRRQQLLAHCAKAMRTQKVVRAAAQHELSMLMGLNGGLKAAV